MSASIGHFRALLFHQRRFADKPLRNCRFDCYDPHPKVQALVKADEATRAAVAEKIRNMNTYRFYEEQ